MSALEEYEKAMRGFGVPQAPLAVYDSCSWRRVGLKGDYKELMYPVIANDGHPDIAGHDLLRALVAAFNAMLEQRNALQQEATPAPRCKHNVLIDPTGSYVCVKCFSEPTAEWDEAEMALNPPVRREDIT